MRGGDQAFTRVELVSLGGAGARGGNMIVLGLILAVIGWVTGISILLYIGIILLVIGLVLLLLGSTGRDRKSVV